MFFQFTRHTKTLLTGLLLGLNISTAAAQNSAEQLYRPISDTVIPALAKGGQFPVGVRTLDIVNANQLDINTMQFAERRLKLEIWYPAKPKANQPAGSYSNETRLGKAFTLQGKAFRDAAINPDLAPLPLVIISHGYTGYRTLMFYLAEHLASHGYVVAAIDHTDSTNAEVDIVKAASAGFPSTLYNRSRDQQFSLNYLTQQSTFISPLIDKSKAGLIGYSMGGYGAINTIGGCYQFKPAAVSALTGIKDETQLATIAKLYSSCAGGQTDSSKVDPRWLAAIAIAPWGNQYQLFDPKAMAAIKTPVLYIAGELDDVSDYSSIKKLFAATGNKNSYLLTLLNARHNIAAHPAPQVALEHEEDLGHYFEPAWDSQQLNRINKHFALAMMNCHIKQQPRACEFLQLQGDSNQLASDGSKTKAWPGFADRFSTGMRWQRK